MPCITACAGGQGAGHAAGAAAAADARRRVSPALPCSADQRASGAVCCSARAVVASAVASCSARVLCQRAACPGCGVGAGGPGRPQGPRTPLLAPGRMLRHTACMPSSTCGRPAVAVSARARCRAGGPRGRTRAAGTRASASRRWRSSLRAASWWTRASGRPRASATTS